jgi:hypothetical protein
VNSLPASVSNLASDLKRVSLLIGETEQSELSTGNSDYWGRTKRSDRSRSSVDGTRHAACVATPSRRPPEIATCARSVRPPTWRPFHFSIAAGPSLSAQVIQAKPRDRPVAGSIAISTCSILTCSQRMSRNSRSESTLKLATQIRIVVTSLPPDANAGAFLSSVSTKFAASVWACRHHRSGGRFEFRGGCAIET